SGGVRRRKERGGQWRRTEDCRPRLARDAGDAVAPAMNAHRSLTRREWLVLTCAGTLAFFGIWALASLAGLTSRQFLPPPWTVAEKFVELTYQPFSGATLQKHLLSSFGRFGMGFALAVLIGIPLGLILRWFRWADPLLS